jgi:hypothetical protein
VNTLRTALFVPLSLLLACPGGGKDEDKLSDEDVEMLYMSVDAPAGFMLGAMFMFGFLEGFEVECPVITSDEATQSLKVEGGCTDEDGQTWSGSFEMDMNGATWSAFDLAGMVVDGTQKIGLDGALTSNMSISGMDGGTGVDVSYVNHRMTNFEGFMSTAFEGGPVAYQTTGSVTISDLGSFGITHSIDHAGACEDEPDEGTTVLAGDFTIEFIADGAVECDGCIPWTSGDQSGSLCLGGVADTGSWDTGW